MSGRESVHSYEDHDQFATMMAGTHRRKVTPLGSPSLVRHQAFWDPVTGDSRKPKRVRGRVEGSRERDRPVNLAERNRNIDDAIVSVYQSLKRRADVRYLRFGSPAPSGHEEAAEQPETVALFSRWIRSSDGCEAPRTGTLADLDTYRSIKISFFWSGFAGTISFESHIEFTTMTVVFDLSDRTAPAEVVRDRSLSPVHAPVEETLLLISWPARVEAEERRRHKCLYMDVWERFDSKVLSKTDFFKLLGPRFVDFRGVVVEPASGSWLVPAWSRRLFTKPYSQQRWQSGFDKQHAPRCTLAAMEKVHPFLKCSLPDDTEFTLSRMLDSRVIFAAALGKQSGLPGEATEPLTYFIFEDTLNAWQLGRLVYRINRAGTARLAATMHFDHMRNAGADLLRAANQLEDALRKGDAPGAEDLKGSMTRLRERLGEVDSSVAALPDKEMLDGSLYYRIERSTYYQSQFARVTGSLRISRVEGYQQYNEFVEQRLGPAYEYIRRLGGMYARVQSDRALLMDRIEGQDALYEEKQISRVQETADFALFLILGPYYVASVAEHLIGDKVATSILWWGATLWGFASFAIHRYRPLKGRLVPALCLGLLVALALLLP